MKRSNLIYCLLAVLLVVSCSIDRKEEPLVIQGIDGKNSLVKSSEELAGDNCANGGLRLDFGVDNNGDGSVQDDEIYATSYVCNGEDGEDGRTSLIKVEPVDGTAEYPQGGVNVSTGIDFNGNGELDEEEVSYTYFIPNGANGENGEDGFSALVKTTVIDEGEVVGNTVFEQGGFLFESGLDTNRNGVLDDDEILYTEYVENGVDGTITVARTTEVEGGTLFETGLDTNDNGILDDSEVLTSNLIKDGVDGTNGFNSLISTEQIDGGIIIRSGLDINRNNILDSEEVMSTSTIFNGADGEDGEDGQDGENGFSSLVSLEQITPNSTFPTGGVKISTGLDLNRNGVLDDSEISNIAYVANGRNGNDGADGQDGEDGEDGEDGSDGQNGLNSLVNILENTPDNNSTTVQTGIDLNNNGVLDSNEVTNSAVIEDGVDGEDGEDGANGQDGLDGKCSFIVVLDEPSGDNCEFGGIKVITGKDDNRNLVFDIPSEVDQTEYICEWRPCVEVIEEDHVIDFEGGHGFYINIDGVSFATNGYANKIKVSRETFNNSKFGNDYNNHIGYIARNSSGAYNGGGGTITITFPEPVKTTSIDFLDSDHRTDNSVKVYNGSTLLGTHIINKYPEYYSTEVVDLSSYENVTKIVVKSTESFAIDNVRYKKVIVTNNCD